MVSGYQPLVFDRSQIAGILGKSYAVVKNWSTGKPLKITPSVRPSGRRGALSLYSLSDLYLMVVAASLIEDGMAAGTVKQLLPLVKKEWFAKEIRGCVVFHDIGTNQPRAKHLERGVKASPLRELLAGRSSHLLNLEATLDWADKRLERLRKGASSNAEAEEAE